VATFRPGPRRASAGVWTTGSGSGVWPISAPDRAVSERYRDHPLSRASDLPREGVISRATALHPSAGYSYTSESPVKPGLEDLGPKQQGVDDDLQQDAGQQDPVDRLGRRAEPEPHREHADRDQVVGDALPSRLPVRRHQARDGKRYWQERQQ